MAVDTLALLTRAEAYTAINDTVTGDLVSSDRDAAVIDIWLTAVSRRIDDLCGPVVVRTVADERHDGGSGMIWLRQSPASSITTVTEYLDGTATTLTAEQDTTLPSDGYLLETVGTTSFLHRRIAGRDDTFPAGRANVKVTYEAGRYADTATVDGKFKMTAAAAMSRLWRREGGAWGNPENPFTEGSSPGFFKVVDPMVREFLSDELRTPAVA